MSPRADSPQFPPFPAALSAADGNGEAMLDLNHPMTRHVFRASGLMDGVMVRGQRMSVSPSAVRAALLAESLPLFAEMRNLALAQFDERAAYTPSVVDEYEVAIRALAGLGGGWIADDCRHGEGVGALHAALQSPGSDRTHAARVFTTTRLPFA